MCIITQNKSNGKDRNMGNIKECIRGLNTENYRQQVFWFERLTSLISPIIKKYPQLKLENFLNEEWNFIYSTLSKQCA